MRIAFVTEYDPADRLQWSGTGFAILEALSKAGLDATGLGPLRQHKPRLYTAKRLAYRLLRRRYVPGLSSGMGRAYARQIETELAQTRYDAVVSLGNLPVNYLSDGPPLAIWADATFLSYIGHYDFGMPVCSETIRAGKAMDQRIFHRADLLMFASEWAAESARRDYGIDPAKVHVVPFGSNFENPPSRENALADAAGRGTECCRLITIGVDWYRKGIPRTIELAALLNARGIRTELDVVGCQPPKGYTPPPFVNIVGFVNKRTPDGERRLTQLLSRAHFHVLFTKAECFGIVFAEANAHALPNIASDVGGIGSAVIDGQGGQKFSLTAPLDAVADYIAHHVRDTGAYLDLATRARNEYEQRLNWTVSGQRARTLIEAMAEERKTQPIRSEA